MPRNETGNYTLPAGNPVTPNTLIEAAWANTTLDDIAEAITNSLARSGGGSEMNGPLRLVNGSAATPALAFSSDTTTGLYRAAAGQIGIATAGVQRLTITASGLTVTGNLSVSGTMSGNGSSLTSLNANNISSGTLADARLSTNVPFKNVANTFTADQTVSVGDTSIFTVNASSSPQLRVENSGASANNRNWAIFGTTAAGFEVRPYNDAYSAFTTALQIERSGSTAGNVRTYGSLFAGILQSSNGYVGIEAGGGSASGRTAFYSPSGTRVGYIGSATTYGTGDNGTIPYVAGAHVFTGRANTAPVSVAFSSTPTFNSAQSNIIYFGTMTANVTSMTISNPVDGAQLQIRFVQDGTGGRTVALPSNVQVSGALDNAANRVTWLVLTYVSSASRWEGTWTRVI